MLFRMELGPTKFLSKSKLPFQFNSNNHNINMKRVRNYALLAWFEASVPVVSPGEKRCKACLCAHGCLVCQPLLSAQVDSREPLWLWLSQSHTSNSLAG